MAGKNTAAFGIYQDRSSVEMAVDRLKTDNTPVRWQSRAIRHDDRMPRPSSRDRANGGQAFADRRCDLLADPERTSPTITSSNSQAVY